jgi:hypothetical protein
MEYELVHVTKDGLLVIATFGKWCAENLGFEQKPKSCGCFKKFDSGKGY